MLMLKISQKAISFWSGSQKTSFNINFIETSNGERRCTCSLLGYD
jgi:hypothetical protein